MAANRGILIYLFWKTTQLYTQQLDQFTRKFIENDPTRLEKRYGFQQEAF